MARKSAQERVITPRTTDIESDSAFYQSEEMMDNTARAKELRRHATESERVLWSRLRARRAGGFKFRRQHPMGNFIADFACLSERLIIEVDGPGHSKRGGEDAARDSWFQAQGFRVLRFSDEEVLRATALVLERILRCCEMPEGKTSPAP